MARLRAARREPGVDITPLIDVVFLLLIFFMVSANFVQNRVIDVSLPESDSALAGTVEILQITVTAAGDYWVAGQTVGSDIESLTSSIDDYAQTLTADQRKAIGRNSSGCKCDASVGDTSFELRDCWFCWVSLATSMSMRRSQSALSPNSDLNQ